jgi:hypothetical protein
MQPHTTPVELEVGRPSVDLDLVMFDFKQAVRLASHKALCCLQSLLLDGFHCKARVEWLRSLQRLTPKDARLRDELQHSDQSDFRREIELLVVMGTFPAVHEGFIGLDRIAELACDPDALWAAHLAFANRELTDLVPAADSETSLMSPQDVDTTIDGSPSVSPTANNDNEPGNRTEGRESGEE